MSMDSQLTSSNPQPAPHGQCGHIPTLRLVEGSSAEVADRVHAVGEWLTTWAGETAVLDNAVGELKAARKQVSRRPECGRPKDDEATRDAKREQLLEKLILEAEAKKAAFELWKTEHPVPATALPDTRTHPIDNVNRTEDPRYG